MIHIDQGADSTVCARFLDNLVSRGVDFEIIGLSFYPWWHGTLDGLKDNITALALRYGKDIVVVETAYPWTLRWADDTHNIIGLKSQLHVGYPATVEGQRRFLEEVVAIVRAAPHGKSRVSTNGRRNGSPLPRRDRRGRTSPSSISAVSSSGRSPGSAETSPRRLPERR
jgi:arabinogalactan endo-1,4-beta-galactosidase